jgi:predicted GNAT superfamily acetyltransferase
MIVFPNEGSDKVVAFLFPRDKDGGYTARMSSTTGSYSISEKEVAGVLKAKGLPCSKVYWPEDPHSFIDTHKMVGGIDIGKPSEMEAKQVRELQREIWGSAEDFLYPSDIHSEDFGLATTLVARQEHKVVGLLFGFYKFGHELPGSLSAKYDGKFRIESQLMGISLESRAKGIGTNLKKEQATSAKGLGIDVINWTVDPLQLPNAVLNFNKLGGICYEYHSNYYQFQNALNQVRASRLAIEWLINSPRVEARISDNQETSSKDLRIIDQIQDTTIVNNGAVSYTLEANSKNIAIQIPEDWSGLQKADLKLAAKWRDITDIVFEHYIRPDRFTLTEVVTDSSRNFYLLGQRLEDVVGL